MPNPHLLICSLGNPAPYQNTLHSSGHIILSSLRSSLSLPPFTKSQAHGNGLLSACPSGEHTLWQSPSLMNISGAGVGKVWRLFLSQHGLGRQECRLVILHDELEAGLGEVRVRKGERGSLKGHNGLKSVREALAAQGGARTEWWRVGVGIGRPDSRVREDVSRWVLRNMSGTERRGVEGAVGRVVELLRGLREGRVVV